MSARRLLAAITAALVFMAACGGSSTAPGGGSSGSGSASGGSGGGGTSTSNAQLLIGTWRLLTSSGVDVTGLNATWTVTATTLTENYPGLCTKTYTYAATATTISSTVTANSCNFQGANEPVGFQGTSNYAFSNNNNTLTVTVPATGAVGTLQRIS